MLFGRRKPGYTTTVDGSVLVVNGRRLRSVRGALVPAP